MKKSKFEKILEDITKSAQDILDKTNDLIQDKKVVNANLYEIDETSSNAMKILGNMASLREMISKTETDFEQLYSFTKKIEFDNEGED